MPLSRTLTVFQSESTPLEVHETNTSSYNTGDDLFEGLTYDDPCAEYEVFAAFWEMRMNLKAWTSLFKANQEAWDKITQAGKDTILCSCPPPKGATDNRRPPSSSTPTALPSAMRSPACQANFTKQPDPRRSTSSNNPVQSHPIHLQSIPVTR